MKLTKGQKIGLIGFIAISGITAIGIYFKRQFNKIYNAQWAFGGIRHLNIGLNRIAFTVLFNIDNTSDMSVDVSEQNYDVFINNVFVSTVKNDTNISIKSRGKSQIAFNIEFKPKDLIIAGLTNIYDLIKDKSKVTVSIKGALSISAGIVKLKKYPFELDFLLSEIVGVKEKDKNVTDKT